MPQRLHGKNPNVRPLFLRPNPTTKIGSKMGGEFTYQPKWDPKTVLTTAAKSKWPTPRGQESDRRAAAGAAQGTTGGQHAAAEVPGEERLSCGPSAVAERFQDAQSIGRKGSQEEHVPFLGGAPIWVWLKIQKLGLRRV